MSHVPYPGSPPPDPSASGFATYSGSSPGYTTYDPLTGQPLSVAPSSPVYPIADPPLGFDPQPRYPPIGYPSGNPTSGYPSADGVPPGYGPYPGHPAAAAGYPTAAAPHYPAAPGFPGYPAVGYPGYPMARPPRPGGATGAAVLAFIQGGFSLLGGISLFSGSTAFGRLSSGSSSYSDVTTELTLLGILGLVAGGLLIAGGATLLSRKSTLIVVGCVLSLLISAYFAVRVSGVRLLDTTIWLPLIYAVLPIIALALTLGRDVRTWVRERRS